MPSIISDKTPCEPHHWPTTRGRLATDGLLEMVPLTAEEHRLATEGDTWINTFIEANAPSYLKRMYLVHRGTGRYLGPEDLVERIAKEALAEVAERRRLLGVS